MRIFIPALLGSALLFSAPAALAQGTSKTGLTIPHGALKSVKKHHDAQFGFRFQYPAGWSSMTPPNQATRVVVGDGTGPSCNVVIVRARIDADPTGRPRMLATFLGSLRQAQVEARYRPEYKARITGFKNTMLGGQPAKRIVVNMMLDKATPFSAMQYITWRKFGVITLTCGARRTDFDKPATQRYFRTIAQSFRF